MKKARIDRKKSLIYGFISGFFISLLALTFTHTPKTLSAIELMMASLFTGVAVSCLFWLFAILLSGGSASSDDNDDDGNNTGYAENYDPDDGGVE